MRIRLFALALALLPVAAFAQNSPVGRWKTIDDETGKVKSIVEVTEVNGTLQGKVVEILHSDRGPNPVCDKCDGANKNKPVKGMTILWGLKKDGDISEDDLTRVEKDLEKHTHEVVAEIDALLAGKEKELLEV